MRIRFLVLSFVFLLVSCSQDDSISKQIQFTKIPDPVWQWIWTAGDPGIIRDGDILRMFYSSLLINPSEKLIIAGATSQDGIHWIPSNNIEKNESIALDSNTGAWDNHLETVSVIQNKNELWMYYSGYPKESDIAGTIVAQGQIGLAKSDNNKTFTKFLNIPILQLGIPNSKDANALFSPTVLKEGNIYYMLYVGYCIEWCSPSFIGILWATSTDGEKWTKLNTPIISGIDTHLDWAKVIKEPDLVKGPDGIFYLFFSWDTSIGVARSHNILGPYEVYPDPILESDYSWESTSVIAPSILIENGKVRMWYMGVNAKGTGADFSIGYAESDFPFNW